MIKALIGSTITNKNKGGQIVKQEKPAMKPFVTEVESVKKESTKSSSISLLPSSTSVEDVGTKSKPKGLQPKINLINKKLITLRNIFKSRLKLIRNSNEYKRKETEKEKTGNKENLFEKLKIGGLPSIAAPIISPFTSFFDRILNAVGQIVLAMIAKMAIDNPQAFIGIIKVLEKALDTIANIFIGTVDLFSSLLVGVEKLENGLKNFIGKTFGEDALNSFGNLASNFTKLFDASILLGGLLLQYTVSELLDSDGRPDKKTKDKKNIIDSKKTPLKTTTKPTKIGKPTTIQESSYSSPQRRLAKKVQLAHGQNARKIFENRYDQLRSKGASANSANARAKADVEKLIKKGKLASNPQFGSLSAKANRRLAVSNPAAQNLMGSKIFGKGVDRATQRFFLTVIGKGGVQGLKSIMGRIPIIGPLLVFGLNWASGDSIARSGVMAVGSGLGQILGTWAGGAIGLIGGPFAPVTVPLGGFVGNILGGLGGEFVGGMLYDMFSGKKGKSPGDMGKKTSTAVGKFFKQDWGKIGKGFVTWLLNTLRKVGSTAWSILSQMVKFMGGMDFFKAVGKVFNDITYAIKKGNIMSVFQKLFEIFVAPGPGKFLYDNLITPFFSNISKLWNSRDKFWSFLTREGTFGEVTGGLSNMSSGLSRGALGNGGFTTPTSDATGVILPGSAPNLSSSGSEGVIDYAKQKGFSEQFTAGLLTQVSHESGGNPFAYNPNDVGKPSYGSFQFRDDRGDRMIKYLESNGIPNAKSIFTNSKDPRRSDKELQKKALSLQIKYFTEDEKDQATAGLRNAQKSTSIEGVHKAFAASERYDGYDNSNSERYRARLADTKTSYTQLVKSGKMRGTPTSQAAQAAQAAPAPSRPEYSNSPPPPRPLPTSTQSPSAPTPARIAPISSAAGATPTISQQLPYEQNRIGSQVIVPLPSGSSQQSPQVSSPVPVGSGNFSNSWVLNQYYIQQVSAFLYKQG